MNPPPIQLNKYKYSPLTLLYNFSLAIMISFKSDTKISLNSRLPNIILIFFKNIFYYNDYVNFYGIELDITDSLTYLFNELKH